MLLVSQITWADRSMNLYVGQVRPVNIGKVARVAVGKDSILQTVVLDDGKVLGRPSAPMVARDGSLLVSDDKANVIYKIKYKS